jgi:hypothetical protein
MGKRVPATVLILLLHAATVTAGSRKPGMTQETMTGQRSSRSIEANLGPGSLLLVGSGLVLLARILGRVRDR